MAASFNALYYPFSRCIDSSTLKQYLLLFDSLTFLDAVDDDNWRGQLYEDLEERHNGYLAYRDLADAMPWLRQQGVIKVRSPETIKSIDSDLTVAATLSDLADVSWTNAADPRRFGLPTTSFDGAPSWHVFRPKIPKGVEHALINDQSHAAHLLREGTDNASWLLSYAAGSSLGINVHLAAADELGLAPITDSVLHHELMLRKLARGQNSITTISQFSEISDAITQRTVFNIIGQILPTQNLAQLSLEDIIEFRTRTQHLRQKFIIDVGRIVSAEVKIGKVGENEQVVTQVTNSLIKSASEHGTELVGVRNKLWPKLIEGLHAPAAVATSAVGLAGSYINHSGYVLAASVALHALAPLKAGLEWGAEKKKAQRTSSAIAYISTVQNLAAK